MNFLKKLGTVAYKALVFFTGSITPVLQRDTIPQLQAFGAARAVDIINGLIGFVGLAEHLGEQIKTLTGTKLDKALLIAPSISNLFLQSQLMTGKKIVDPALWDQAMRTYTDATVLMLKAIDEAHAE